MSVEIRVDYEGQLHCAATHGPSGVQLATDAPVDNHGKGESFSPTDLLATALGTCMVTTMGIVAEKKGLSLEGLRLEVRKHMSPDLPRRVTQVEVAIQMPISEEHADREMLQRAAEGCPVAQSIHPAMDVPIRWSWSD